MKENSAGLLRSFLLVVLRSVSRMPVIVFQDEPPEGDIDVLLAEG